MESRISKYIDSLNDEKRPRDHGTISSIKYNELMETVRSVKSLKDYEEPEVEYEARLLNNVKAYSHRNIKKTSRIRVEEKGKVYMLSRSNRNKSLLNRVLSYGTVAAVLVLIIVIGSLFMTKKDIVKAMETSYNKLKAYHGVMETVSINAAGEEFIQGEREVWADEDGRYASFELEGSSVGEKTINNGEIKWRILANEKEVEIYSAFPDSYSYGFEIGNEIVNLRNALKIEELGEEKVSNKLSLKLGITPKGGDTYYLWIDKETNLPIQRLTPMTNAMQYRVTYKVLEGIDAIPSNILALDIPKGYTEINKSSEQLVNTNNEASEILGYDTIGVENLPDGVEVRSMTVDKDNNIFRIYYKVFLKKQGFYKNFILLQKKTGSEFEMSPTSIQGSVNSNKAEYLPSLSEESKFISYASTYGDTTDTGMLRWQEGGYEYALIGDIEFEALVTIGEDLLEKDIVFDSNAEAIFRPEVAVDVDYLVEENTQKSVDQGHSPWKLDPKYVAMVEASLMISPEGIVGDYPIDYENITISYNDGVKAIAEINDTKSLVKRIYLERLIRQDETGIWTMVGYDPVID